MLEASRRFIDLLAGRPPQKRVNLIPFDRDVWFRAAYSTISRGVPQGQFQTAAKRACCDLIFNRIPQLRPAHLDADMQVLIILLAEMFPLSIGQAQKLVNIVLKYYACVYYSGRDPAWSAANQWVAALTHRQHVPIDSIVLYNLCRNAPAACNGFVWTRASFAYSQQAESFIWSTSAYIYEPDYDGNDTPRFAWSKIRTYAPYFRLQTIIRALAAEKNATPVLYEMQYLWTQAEEE